MNKTGSYLTITFATTSLFGCAVGPDYAPPEFDAGAGWIAPARPADIDVDGIQWWQAFHDETLDALIELALDGNVDIRLAEARIAEARALRAATAGRRYPSADLSATVTRRRQSENGPIPINTIPGIERDQTIYEPGFDALWELDLFGGTRRAVEAADARVEAAGDRAQASRLSMIAELARSYFELRGAQHELDARRAAVAASDAAIELMRRRLEAGDITESELTRAEAEQGRSRSELAPVEARARGAALAIGTLLGGLPETQLGLIDRTGDYASLAPIPVGERGDVLRRRPDVRAAERALAAATADVGVATAALFPKVSIAASGGFQSLETGTLFDAASETFAIAPLISWHVFDGGRMRAQVNAAEARVEIAALDYEKTVLEALGEAERALLRYDAGLESLAYQRASLDAARRGYRQAEARYAAGDTSRLELLDAEGYLRNAEQAYARTHSQAATDLIALCKALGGGWNEPEASG